MWQHSKHVTQSARRYVGQRENKSLPKLQLVQFHTMDVLPLSRLLLLNGTKMLFTRLHQQEPVLNHHAKLKLMLGLELQPLRANSWQEQLRNSTPWLAWRATPSTGVNQATLPCVGFVEALHSLTYTLPTPSKTFICVTSPSNTLITQRRSRRSSMSFPISTTSETQTTMPTEKARASTWLSPISRQPFKLLTM